MKRALVLSLVFALGLGFIGFGQTLSGSWSTNFILNNPTGGFDLDVATVLDVDYTVGDWTFGSYSKLTYYTTVPAGGANGWIDQKFDAAGVLGAFTLTSLLQFTPDPGAFKYFKATADVSIAGVTFGAKFEIKPASKVSLTLTGSGVAGDITIGVTVVLGNFADCGFDFSSAKIKIGFPFCCATIAGELNILCTGFDYVKFCTTGITIENVPWLTIDACVKFQLQTKTFTITPKVDLGLIGCDFDLFWRLASNGVFGPPSSVGTLIDGFYIDGIQISCTIGDAVTFTGITYWGPKIAVYAGLPAGFPGILYGYEDYFEAYQIATTDDGCCGPFSFDVTAYFKDSDKLFDIGLFVANMSIQVASQFTFDFGVTLDVVTPTVSTWTFGFLVEW